MGGRRDFLQFGDVHCIFWIAPASLYGGLPRKSWTLLEDCQRKISCNFGLWYDYLRFTVAVVQTIIALVWVFECAFGNSSGFCPIK